MQVNASNQVQASNPLEGLIADKSDKTNSPSAKEAFAAALAKAGMNVQGGISASYQAPNTLAPSLNKPIRTEAKDEQRSQVREPQDRAVARGHDDDKTTGQARASEVRSDNKPDPKARKTDDNQQAQAKDDAPQAKASDNQVQGANDKAQDSAGQVSDSGKAAAADAGKAAVAAKVEENASAAVAAFVAAPVQQAQVQAPVDEGQVVQAGVNTTADTGPKVVAAAVTAVAEEVQTAAPQVQATVNNGPAKTEEKAPEAVANLGQMVKAAVAQVRDDSHGPGREAQVADPKRDEQAAMLSRIIGDQGQVKIDTASKAAQTVSQPASTLSANLTAVETQTQQAVTGPGAGFGDNKGMGNGAMQNNSGQPSNGPAVQANMPSVAQVGAAAATLAQSQTNSFTASLAAAQAAASTDGAAEIQTVQAPSGAQANQGAQTTQPAMGQAQAAQDLRNATAAQKPAEVKLPIPAKEILDQINVQISKAAKDGLDKITVQMRPEALGRVEVQMKLGHEGQVSAHIVADRPETLEALKRDSSQLEKALNDAGFKTDSGSLQFSLRGEQQPNQQQAANDQKPGSFFDRGRALDEAEASETIVQTRPRANSRSGVDISV